MTDPDLVDVLQDTLGELATTMGIRMLAAGPDLVSAEMPVAGNRQPYGLLHGGANAVLAETIGSIHASLLAPSGCFPVGIELSCSHHRSATDGIVIGTSRPITAGRTLAALAISIVDPEDRPLCTARLTCLFRTAP